MCDFGPRNCAAYWEEFEIFVRVGKALLMEILLCLYLLTSYTLFGVLKEDCKMAPKYFFFLICDLFLLLKYINCTFLVIHFFFHCSTAPSGPTQYWGFTITHRHTTLGSTPLVEWSARHRDLYLKTHITHKREIYPCLRRDSNSPSQQANSRRPTPKTARPPGSAVIQLVFRKWISSSDVTVPGATY